MSRNVIEDYKVITGYLPVLKAPFPHGGNVGRLNVGETWKTEAEVRAYMIRRGFGTKQELAKMHFDNSLPRGTVNQQVWGTTVTHSNVIKNMYPDIPPIEVKYQPDAPKGGFVVVKDLPPAPKEFGDAKAIGEMIVPTEPPLEQVGIGVNKMGHSAVQSSKGLMTGASMVVVAFIFAIGYLIFARGK
jgi:hypothetical protein